MSDKIIHVGLPKCASTWMQRSFFPCINNVNCLYKDEKVTEIFESILDVEDANIIDHKFELYNIISAQDQSSLNLFSKEGISFGGKLFGGKKRDRIRNAERIHNIFPNAKIIFIIRKQSDMLLSVYYQYVTRGGHMSLNDFIGKPIEGYNFESDEYKYDIIAKKYIELFGRKSVLVLPFESLKENREQFMNDICEFLECPKPNNVSFERKNRTPAPQLMYLLKIWNKYFQYSIHNTKPFIPIPYRIGIRSVRLLDKIV